MKETSYCDMPKRELDSLIREFLETRDVGMRERIIAAHLNMARFFAKRFGSRSDQYEDLLQVATMGLINAVDRYDTSHGTEFATFATVTILGEIKRYFRDKTWSVKVPRRIKDMNVMVNSALEKLSKEMDHQPSYEEVADYLGCTIEEIIESREAVMSYNVVSLDMEIEGGVGESSSTLMEMIGNIDKKLDRISDRLSLQSGLKQLRDQEKFVIFNRYFNNMSQAQIAKMMDVSQMQVSRIQKEALKKLKRILSK